MGFICVSFFLLWNVLTRWNDDFFEKNQFGEIKEIMEIKCDDLEKSKTVYYSWYQMNLRYKTYVVLIPRVRDPIFPFRCQVVAIKIT